MWSKVDGPQRLKLTVFFIESSKVGVKMERIDVGHGVMTTIDAHWSNWTVQDQNRLILDRPHQTFYST